MQINNWKINILKYILWIGFFALTVFSLNYLLSKNYFVFSVEFLFALFFLLAIFMIKKGYYLAPSIIGWVGVLTVLITLMFTGGIQGTGIIWWCLMPIISFIIFGINGGTIAVLVSIIIFFTLGFLSYFKVIDIYFEPLQVRQTLSMILVVSGIMFYFEKISSLVREDAIEKNNLLEIAKKDLQQSIESLKKEKDSQEKVRTAIVNVLEDARELELKLEEEKEKANTIINSMGEGLFVLNDRHQIALINPIAEKTLGVNAKDVIGRDWSEIVTTYIGSEKIDTEKRSTLKSLKENKVVITNLEDNHYYMTENGKRFPVISTTTPIIKNGKVVGVIKVFRDVTSDKNSKEIIEKEVIEKTAELSSSIASLPVGFVLIDGKGEIKMVNSRFKDILEIKIDDLNDIKIPIDISKNDIIEYKNKFLKILRSSVTSDDKKQVLGTIILIEDVTEAKIVDRSRDEFFSIASHELRTPLTAIRGNTELIRQYYKDQIKDPEMLEMIADIHESSIKLIDIVNDFLNVSRLDMGRMEFKKEKVDIPILIEKTVKDLMPLATKSNLYLRFKNKSDNLKFLYTDSVRFTQVLTNLLGNGIKYTEKGGVEVILTSDSKNITITVKDTGRGISESGQNLLFHKFQQTGESLMTRDTSKGTGLGLYISKKIVEAMGGKIWLEKSIEAKGSEFCFSLPIDKSV